MQLAKVQTVQVVRRAQSVERFELIERFEPFQQGCKHDHGLHPRSESGRPRR